MGRPMAAIMLAKGRGLAIAMGTSMGLGCLRWTEGEGMETSATKHRSGVAVIYLVGKCDTTTTKDESQTAGV